MSTLSSSGCVSQIDIYPKQVNWRRILDDMKEHGLSYSAQAEALGRGWSSYQCYLDGGEPRYGNGAAILRLHVNICGIELTMRRIEEAEMRE